MLLSIVDPDKRWLRRLIGCGALLGFILRFLFGTLLGVLLLSWALYASLPLLIGTEPWAFDQLLVWFSDLSDEAKVGLASSLVTVLGFFIALHTAMHSWRRQTAATLRMAAADSIDRVIEEVMAVMLQIELFSEAVAREVARVRDQRIPLEQSPILSHLSDDVVIFRANRQRLLQLEQEVFALPARYSVLFLPLSGVESAFEAIERQVGIVTKKVWVPAPAGGTDHPDHRRQLVERVDPEKYHELATACEVARDEISGVHGGLRSALLSPVLEFNLVALARVLRQTFGRANEGS